MKAFDYFVWGVGALVYHGWPLILAAVTFVAGVYLGIP